MFKKLIKSIDNLADAIDCLVEKLDAIFIESKQPLLTLGPGLYRETISGADTEVQKRLGIKKEGKKPSARRRWTSKEEALVIAGYSKGYAPAAIRDILKRNGYDRGEHAIVDHMCELRKKMEA